MPDIPTISITANGKSYEVPLGSTIPDFLDGLQLAPHRVVVEHNQQALTPAEMKQQTLHSGDNLEIVKVVAGG
jgi:thiamine biosynthesis protein ThiS